MKKLLILLLSVALVAAACSDGESHIPVTGQIDSGEETATDVAVPTAEATAAPTAVPEAEDDGDEVAQPEIPDEEDPGCQTAGDSADVETADGLLPVDPEVKVGTLDNGLTYYLRSNDSPGGSLALRLVVNAGSLNEAVVGGGHAHYLEHMLFNGTEKYPGNEITDACKTSVSSSAPTSMRTPPMTRPFINSIWSSTRKSSRWPLPSMCCPSGPTRPPSTPKMWRRSKASSATSTGSELRPAWARCSKPLTACTT